MTGSHEVRGSIPLGSTNTYKHLGIRLGCFLILSHWRVRDCKNGVRHENKGTEKLWHP